MRIGISSLSQAWLLLFPWIVAVGCGEQHVAPAPYDVGEEGQLRFWLEGTVCGLYSTCSPTEVGLGSGFPPHRVFVAQAPDRLDMEVPLVSFESSDPSVFTVAEVLCNPEPGEGAAMCETVDTIFAYVVTLELRSTGSADLVARRSDGTVVDRGQLKIERAPGDGG